MARAVRAATPAHFAIVMATGIVSADLRQAGLPGLATGLLVIAVAGFLILLAATGWRAAARPGDRRAWLARPGRVFGSFAAVAACGVLGSGLAQARQPAGAAVLAVAALAGWVVLTWLGPARLIRRTRARGRARIPVRSVIAQADGTWYLWAVATQALAIAAAYLRPAGLLGPRVAAVAAITAWSAGLLLYLAVMAVVLARLAWSGLGPAGGRAPYWVAMGAAAISVLAATRVIAVGSAAGLSPARPVLTSLACLLWVAATLLLPVLAAGTAAWGWSRSRWRPRYAPSAWVVIFPLGMYTMASAQLGRTVRWPLISHAGAGVGWVAAAGWGLTFAALVAVPVIAAGMALAGRVEGRRRRRRPGDPLMSRYDISDRRPGPGIPPWGLAGGHQAGQAGRSEPMKRYKYQAVVKLLTQEGNERPVPLPGPSSRMVVRAHHPQTHAVKLFSALVNTSPERLPGDSHVIVTVTVLGDDAGDYLAAGEDFELWRGSDIGQGVVTRRVFV